MMKIKRGFTLIELLIVVAIIAILALIAVPNFLEAQTRSKVSRAMADMRSIATALESYAIDHNHYPPPYPSIAWGTNVPNELSTPIAYVSSSISFVDPFSKRFTGGFGGRYNRYGYIAVEYETNVGTLGLSEENLLRIGKWRFDSFGPDERSGPKDGPSNWPNESTYDPTNGTISRGDIYRSHRDPVGRQI